MLNAGNLHRSAAGCWRTFSRGQIHTVVVCHCGTHLASNVQTFTTFGLNTKEAHALLRETVALSVKLGWQIRQVPYNSRS